jgi:predicted dehydrogenase
MTNDFAKGVICLKAVLVGCGLISNAWLGPLSKYDDVEIVGLVDLNEETAQKRKEEHKLSALVSSDLDATLKKTKPDIVFNCTIPAAHYEVTTTALKRKCHVLSEKPMAESVTEAKKMIKAADKAGRLFVVMQNWRYTRNIRRLKKFLDTNPIGDLTTLNADFYVGAHFSGFREEMNHVLLKDMAIHTFDAARFLSSQNPKNVFCYEWNPAGSWYNHDASAMAMFEMTGNVKFNYRGSWCSEGHRTPWESEWRILGTKGSIRWNGSTEMTCEIAGADSDDAAYFREQENVEVPTYSDVEERLEGHAAVIADFLNALKTNTEPETICTDNIKSLAMVYGAIESAEKGKKITIKN